LAAGFGKDIVTELFILLERSVEHKVNGTMIYEYNVDDSALKIF
jgi:hypothetical protein